MKPYYRQSRYTGHTSTTGLSLAGPRTRVEAPKTSADERKAMFAKAVSTAKRESQYSRKEA